MSYLAKSDLLKALADGSITVTSNDPAHTFSAEEQVTESSIDLHIDDEFYHYKTSQEIIDLRSLRGRNKGGSDEGMEMLQLAMPNDDGGIVLAPRATVFTTTLEHIWLKNDLVGFIFTRSWAARLGLMVTCGAPKSPPGLGWKFPIQLVNCSDRSIVVYPRLRAVQLMVSSMASPAPYSGEFQGASQPIQIPGSDDELDQLIQG